MSSDLYRIVEWEDVIVIADGRLPTTQTIPKLVLKVEPHELNRIALHNLLLTLDLDAWQKFLAKPERLP